MTTDLTLVVTAHDETAVSGPTMTSADRAVAAAREAGITVQTLLVLDGTIGQNAVQQAKIFTAAVPLTGLVVTKLDGSARGGVVVAVHEAIDVPVKFVGVGEAAEDLVPFEADAFPRQPSFRRYSGRRLAVDRGGNSLDRLVGGDGPVTAEGHASTSLGEGSDAVLLRAPLVPDPRNRQFRHQGVELGPQRLEVGDRPEGRESVEVVTVEWA